jgi:FG-GAP repeat/Abnormal spindle-like microcephaly-assoc'd, ASPM-SPD-2-Hydin
MRCLRLLPPILFTLITSLLAQWTPAAKNDPSLIGTNSSVTVAKLPHPTTLASTSANGRSSTAKSPTGLSSLPADAQGPISAALGKDDTNYWVHPSAKGFGGENPKQALQAEFTRQGAEVSSLNLRWGLETRAYGYGDALHPLKGVAPRAKANRVEYGRGGVTEWYENGPLGLEQGFTLAYAPGKANGQALTVELGLRGDLVTVLTPGGKTLELRGKDGRAALRYTGLQARDARGRELRSWLEVRGERLLVRVEDGGARYPIIVDPWIQQAELTASDGAPGDSFGYSVAESGGTVVVGADTHQVGSNFGQGAAYVFVHSGTTWSQQAELTASDGEFEDYFGSSVAVSGSRVVVGAPWHHPIGSNLAPGAVYVFVQNGTTWSQQAELTASDGGEEDHFGWSVAVSGTTVVVSSPFANQNQGLVYVFVHSGTTWSQQAELTASDGGVDDEFGESVALDGSTVVVGAHSHKVGSNTEPGPAYVFVHSGTTWSQQAELTASDGGAEDQFGESVAVDGSTVVVGAPWHTVGSNQYQGAAYVFVHSGTTWSQQAELTASDGEYEDYFGSSVAVSSSRVVVGAPWHTVGSNQYQGAAYVFVQNGTTWSQQAELTASDGEFEDYFGSSVAVSGATAVVGVQTQTFAESQLQGVAYLFGSLVPPYTLLAAPNSLDVVQGEQGTSTITITPANGFSGNVLFSASALPSGVTAAFNPNTATSTSTLTLTASRTAPVGTADVMVTGTSDGLTQTTRQRLTVTTGVIVSLSPASLSFGNEVVNSTGAGKTVKLTNPGTAALPFGITASANFTFSNNCGGNRRNLGEIGAGATCKVGVHFAPTQLGTLTGTISFSDYAANTPQTVVLSGTGIAGITLTPSSLTFAETEVGHASDAVKTTLHNNLLSTLTGISYSTKGPFSVSTSTCSTTLDEKKSCTISVTFSPTEAGTSNGTLTVSDSANNSPQTVSLTGTGTAEAVYASPTSVDFGNQSVGTTSNPIKVALFNEGSTQITVTSVSASGNFAVTANYCVDGVKPNSHCYIDVVFSPTQSGALSGTLMFVDNANGSPEMASLSGTGN